MDVQWGADQLDLEAYLARIGADASASLAQVHRAQLATIPFENLDVMLGRGVSVALPDVAAKLVHARRGGYCYEHATLLGAALERLGFDVERRLARVGDPSGTPRPRSHLVLLLRSGDDVLLADTGFGAGLIEPVALRDGVVIQQGAWSFRTDLTDRGWVLLEQRAGAWVPLYLVPEETTYPADVDAANWVTATSPGSHFTQRILVQRKEPDRLRWLVGRMLMVDTPEGRQSERLISDDELGGVLADLGLPLDADEVATLAGTLSPLP